MAYVQQQYGDWLSDAIGYVKEALPVVQQIVAPTAGGGTAARVASPTAPAVPAPGPSSFSPGGFVEKNQTLLLLGAAGLVVLLVVGQRGSRRR